MFSTDSVEHVNKLTLCSEHCILVGLQLQRQCCCRRTTVFPSSVLCSVHRDPFPIRRDRRQAWGPSIPLLRRAQLSETLPEHPIDHPDRSESGPVPLDVFIVIHSHHHHLPFHRRIRKIETPIPTNCRATWIWSRDWLLLPEHAFPRALGCPPQLTSVRRRLARDGPILPAALPH